MKLYLVKWKKGRRVIQSDVGLSCIVLASNPSRAIDISIGKLVVKIADGCTSLLALDHGIETDDIWGDQIPTPDDLEVIELSTDEEMLVSVDFLNG